MNAPLPFFSNERTRPHGIGGTDIGAVLGLSPYKTALELWADLVGNEGPSFRDQLHLRFGQHNESFIAREFERATGLQTCEHQGTLFHREHGFMFGHVDRFLVKQPGELPVVDGVVVTDALLECKTASAFARHDWGTPGTDEVPPLYLVQCAWYLAITGCERAEVAVLLGNSDFRIYQVTRDLELESLLISHAKQFWFDHVLAKVPPAPSSARDASILFPKEEPGKSLEANEMLLEVIKDYEEKSRQAQGLSDECERLKTEILSYMGHAEKLTHAGKTLATWKCAKNSQRIDTKSLAAAHPDIALAHTSTVLGSRRFLLKGAV